MSPSHQISERYSPHNQQKCCLCDIFPSHLNKGSKADSCLSKVCMTQVFLNFVSSAMASSFSVATSAENVFLINFSKGFLKSTPSERFNGIFIQPAISSPRSQFSPKRSYVISIFPSSIRNLEAIFRSLPLLETSLSRPKQPLPAGSFGNDHALFPVSVVFSRAKIPSAQHWGRRAAHLSENKGVKRECKKFGENSRQMAPVSTICDEYCSSRAKEAKKQRSKKINK